MTQTQQLCGTAEKRQSLPHTLPLKRLFVFSFAPLTASVAPFRSVTPANRCGMNSMYGQFCHSVPTHLFRNPESRRSAGSRTTTNLFRQGCDQKFPYTLASTNTLAHDMTQTTQYQYERSVTRRLKASSPIKRSLAACRRTLIGQLWRTLLSVPLTRSAIQHDKKCVFACNISCIILIGVLACVHAGRITSHDSF